MNLENGIQQIKNNLENSYIFTKFTVEDDLNAERSCVIVKLWCMSILNESSEFVKILRMIRKNVPATHYVKMKLFFTM